MELEDYLNNQLITFLDASHTFLKGRLSSAYGDDWYEKAVKPHLNANMVERVQEMLENPLRAVDMAKKEDELYGLEHIRNILNGNKDLLAGWFGSVGNAWGMYRELAEMRHNLAHRRHHHRVTTRNARRSLDVCATLLQAMKSPLQERFESDAEALNGGSMPWGPGPPNNLPHREEIVFGFIGRDRELQELFEWFHGKDTRRWVVWGDGGAGKSAVAYEFATRIRDRNPSGLLAIGWMSAKTERFDVDTRSTAATTADFTDRPTAVATLLRDVYEDVVDPDMDQKQAEERLLDCLDEMPALIVVDDLDTLLNDESLVEFVTYDLPQRKSRILLTSRTKLTGLRGTEVQGFEGDILRDFLISRSDRFHLDVDEVLARATRIQDATRGYPLYTEDLLRLASFDGLDNALKEWSGRKGDAARTYALKRQVERLSEPAKDALVAIAVAKESLSKRQLENVLGRSDDDVEYALQQLQRTFLILPPHVTDGTPRFETNGNTKRLVAATFGQDAGYRATASAVKNLFSTDRTWAAQRAVESGMKRAVRAVRDGNQEAAEDTLKDAISLNPGEAELHSTLGWLYKMWRPQKVDDARAAFKVAHRLGSTRLDTYWHWVELELQNDEWRRAAEAAELGLERTPDQQELLYYSGYARSRLGKTLARSADYEQAEAELAKADTYLKAALKSDVASDREVSRSRVLRAIVLNCEQLQQWRELDQYLSEWEAEDPSDLTLRTERERLLEIHPELRTIRDASSREGESKPLSRP